MKRTLTSTDIAVSLPPQPAPLTRRTASWNRRDVTHEPSAQPVYSEERRRSA